MAELRVYADFPPGTRDDGACEACAASLGGTVDFRGGDLAIVRVPLSGGSIPLESARHRLFALGASEVDVEVGFG